MPKAEQGQTKKSGKKRQITDRASHYNAFGRDPNGLLAYYADLFYGPDYVPAHDMQQFVGAPEPPKYGAPAQYQLRQFPYLAQGFQPTLPRGGATKMASIEDGEDTIGSGHLEPPKRYDPKTFEALRWSRRWMRAGELASLSPSMHS